MKLDYGATHRNRAPILEVLDRWLGPEARVLEVASGSGQHAAAWCAERPGWRWQPSDLGADERASIDAWCGPLSNVAPALALDVLGPWPEGPYDAVFCANMIHIAPWSCTPALLHGAAAVLRPGGRLLTYGPYRVDGRHTSPSNAEFDASLRARNPTWGVRDVGEVHAVAEEAGLAWVEQVELPANNRVLVFQRPPIG